MGSMAALYGPRFAAFYEAMLAPLLNLPRVYEDKTLSRATVEAYEEARRKGERRGTGGLQGSTRTSATCCTASSLAAP